MEELNKKVIGNAMSAYMMVIVSLTFLFSKQKYLNHPFVKSHVISAFLLHILLFTIWFVMSFDFFGGMTLLSYSVNSIITASLMLIVFAGILYGMLQAHKGNTVTLGEMFHKASSGKTLISKNKSEGIQESDAIIMILSHVPFLGFVVGTRNRDMTHMRDVLQLNFLSTLSAVLLLIVGYPSLASIVLLAYIVWSVVQAITLITQGTIISLGIDSFPTVEEKYILQKTTIRYVLNTLNKKLFVPFREIRAQKTLERKNDEITTAKTVKSPYSILIKNIVVLLILFILCVVYFSWDSPVLILFLFPACYLAGYSERSAYKMPYIYDIYDTISSTFLKIGSIFSGARKLKNTTKTETIKMSEVRTEAEKES